MANAVGNIWVGLRVDTGQTRAFTSAANVIGRDSDRMRAALGGTSRSVQSLRSTMNQGWRSRIFGDMIRQASQTNNEVAKLRASMLALTALTGTSVTGAFAATYLLQTADAANRLNNQLRTVATSEENLIAVRQRLYDVSQLTRSDMQATVTLYARMSRAAQEFGASQEQIVRATETIQKAFAIGGASQAEAQGAAIQLSQGIASDRFSGEEYRSVAENAPVLLQNMARHLGVTIGKLREMAHAGELTGKVVTDAILGASEAIDRDFNKTVVTAGQGLTRVGNAFLMYIGETDASVGATRRLSEALSALAENFDSIMAVVGPAAGVALAGVGGRLLSGPIGGIAKQAREARQAALEGAAASTLLAKNELIRARAVATSTAGDVEATKAKIASGQADIASQRQTLAIAQSQREAAVARAELNRGIAEATGRTSTYQAALRAQNDSTKAVLVTQRSLRLAEKELADNKALLTRQTQVATTAATAHGRALAAASVQARAAAVSTARLQVAMAMMQRVGGGILGAVGGVPGILLTTAIIGVTHWATETAKAEEKTAQLVKEMYALGLVSAQTAGAIDEAASSLDNLTVSATQLKVEDYKQLLDQSMSNIGHLRSELATLMATFANATVGRDGNLMAIDFGAGIGDAAAPIMRAITAVDQFRSKSISAEDAIAELNAALLMPNADQSMAAVVDQLTAFIEKASGAGSQIETLGQKLRMMTLQAGLPEWLGDVAQRAGDFQKFAEGFVAAQEAVAGVVVEQERVLRLSEEQAAVEKKMADLRKAAVDAGADESKISEAALRADAERLVSLEKQIKAQNEFNGKITDLSTEIEEATKSFEDMQAAATIDRLLKDFSTGTMKADDLKNRLAQINSVNLSDPMNTLIAKIIAAIGPLSTLLGIFNGFNAGTSPLGGSLPGPANPGGSVGRSRRERQERERIGQGVLDTAISDAGLSDKDSWIRDKTAELKKQAEALGGVAVNAEATAAQLWAMDQAQKASEKSGKDAADAAKKYAEGMANLNRELAAAPLDPFLKEVLSTAESMGIATDELEAFIAAVTSGGIDVAPGKFRDIADAMRDIKAANILQDLSFQQGQLGRNVWDAEVFETLRDAGIEVDSVYGRIIDQQIRLTRAMEIGKSAFSDTFGGLAKDLMNGVSLTDALTNAMGRMRDRLLDMAIDLAGSAFTGFLGNMLQGIFGGSGFSSSITGSSGGFFPGITGPRLLSFDGGGRTPSGPRAGGLDGKGGFMALLHPDESIIDHTKGRNDTLAALGASTGKIEVRNRLELEIKGEQYEEQSRTTRNEGGVNIEQIVLAPVKKAFADGSMDSLMSGVYGLKRRPV